MFFKLKNLQKSYISFGGIFIFVLASMIFKISPILGSKFSFFSFANVAMPVLGTLGTLFPLLGIAVRFGWRFFILQTPFSLSSFSIPSVCAAYYWSQSELYAQRARWFAIAIPIVSAVLFIMHPVGSAAALYTVYWIIPVIVQIKKSSNIFARALTSTFIAHAVGSVIWLYTGPAMTSVEWLSLIPVVFVERICFGGMMVIMYYAIQTVRSVVISTVEKGYMQQ